ncbi:MAG: hypothetical protein CVT84_12370 [Alphaproteobacteria bacterium HGW-Alphaproteobacteria-6]|nr:MAG: hypothetical protein CVT84_12370 [Alphaproteobacteria bacterium HGW-Alphaproteobacteria-6]
MAQPGRADPLSAAQPDGPAGPQPASAAERAASPPRGDIAFTLRHPVPAGPANRAAPSVPASPSAVAVAESAAVSKGGTETAAATPANPVAGAPAPLSPGAMAGLAGASAAKAETAALQVKGAAAGKDTAGGGEADDPGRARPTAPRFASASGPGPGDGIGNGPDAAGLPNGGGQDVAADIAELPLAEADGMPAASPGSTGDPAPARGGERAVPGVSLPANLGQQMAEVAARFPDRPVELTLSPEELGRVRMTFTTGDGTLTMNLSADRPETLELLRRHIGILAQDFRDLGFANLSFSFAGGGDPQGAEVQSGPTTPDRNDGETAARTPSPIASTDRTGAGGLDLRL